MESNPNSLLCRIHGAYSLTVGNTVLRLVVMDNVLAGISNKAQVYDLKGTTEDRWVDPSRGGVLKDNNFRPYQMMFTVETYDRIRRCLRDDAEFLESLGVMD